MEIIKFLNKDPIEVVAPSFKEAIEKNKTDLRGANLRGANLSWADLSGADLSGADLSEANLYWADLGKADLYGADLYGANLCWADLIEANLSKANLSKADLSRAYLSGAYLSGANLSGAKPPNYQICPQVGSFTAFKATSKGVITIEIPKGARRTSSLVGRKCRADRVIVLEMPEGVTITGSFHNPDFTYEQGKIVVPHSYNDDIRKECAPGIHFFITREEAEEWYNNFTQ